MRHSPLPAGHKIAREDYEWAHDLLVRTDTRNLLGARRITLRRVLGFMHSLRLNFEDVMLVECGARQQTVTEEDYSSYNPAISHFMALHASELNAEYRPYDPGYAPEVLDGFSRARKLPRNERPTLLRRNPDLVPAVVDGIKRMSLANYDELVRVVQGTEKAVLLFSNYVLNDPNLRTGRPFWHLPGLHHHSCSIMEMASKLGVTPESLEATEEADKLDWPFTPELVRRMAGPHEAHAAVFRQHFGVEAEVQRALGEKDESIRYFWSKPGDVSEAASVQGGA